MLVATVGFFSLQCAEAAFLWMDIFLSHFHFPNLGHISAANVAGLFLFSHPTRSQNHSSWLSHVTECKGAVEQEKGKKALSPLVLLGHKEYML